MPLQDGNILWFVLLLTEFQVAQVGFDGLSVPNFVLRLLHLSISSASNGVKTRMKALIVGTTCQHIDKISAVQLYPFFANRQRLRQELGLEFKVASAEKFSEIYQACKQHSDVDVMFIRPTWREDAQEAERIMRAIRRENPQTTIVFIDPFDQTSSRYFGVLPYVSWFLKYQRLKEVSDYHKPFVGGTQYTDYLAHRWNWDLDGWHVGSAVPKGYEHRIVAGWNIAINRRFKSNLFMPEMLHSRKKDIAVFCRMSYGSQNKLEWYGRQRMEAVQALQPLATDYPLAVSGEFDETKTISTRQYRSEIKRSRIIVAPFGWGESTWRDYEAVCFGGLLIKPNVDHIQTNPNIYVPGETYVPVKWDYSDLEEKCRYYLEHPEAAQQIVQNARQVYKAYFKQGEFLRTIKRILLGQITLTYPPAPAQLSGLAGELVPVLEAPLSPP
ncbi:glycosyltransferase family 1 protein [Phormidium tenue FACHB-886]|nr:glycosyltransferase family 1 protein [Phormidium tenue FACHB-886]